MYLQKLKEDLFGDSLNKPAKDTLTTEKSKEDEHPQAESSEPHAEVKVQKHDKQTDTRFTRSDDYKQQFFKKHKGLLGFLYICPYCGHPTIRNSSILDQSLEVDHVIPVTKAEKSWLVRLFLRVCFFIYGSDGINSTRNLVSACHYCNQKKKGKGGMWIVRGTLGRLLFPIAWVGIPIIAAVILIQNGLLWHIVLCMLILFFGMIVLLPKKHPYYAFIVIYGFFFATYLFFLGNPVVTQIFIWLDGLVSSLF